MSVFILLVAVGLFVVAALIAVGIAIVANSSKRSGVHSDPHMSSHGQAPLKPADFLDREDLSPKIRKALAENKKIEAIKLYREETGVGLKEAKAYIEQVQAGVFQDQKSSGAAAFNEPGTLSPDIIKALENREKIKAIKLYRQHTGVGLKEAKAFIESIQDDYI